MTQEYDLEPVFVFLSSLRANNRKDWFDPHKAEYENARNQFAHLLEAVLAELRDLEELRAVDPRACIQRIYRDIRFSKDKSPYHTSLSATFPAWNQRASHLPYYIHLEPGGASIVAGGLHTPTPTQLARFRKAAAQDASALKAAASAPDFYNTFGDLSGETLKTVPREFPRDHPEADLLRRKQILAILTVSDSQALSNGLAQHIASACRALRPLLLVLQEMAGPPEQD